MKTNQMLLIAALIATGSTAAQAQYLTQGEALERGFGRIANLFAPPGQQVYVPYGNDNIDRVNAQNQYEQNRLDTERRHQETIWAIRNQNH